MGNWLHAGRMEGFEGGERERTAWLGLMQMASDGINAGGWAWLMWVGGSSEMSMNIYCFKCTKWTRAPLIRGQERKASFESNISMYITKTHAHTRASCLISSHSSLDCLFGVRTSNSYLFQGLLCFTLRSSQPTEASDFGIYERNAKWCHCQHYQWGFIHCVNTVICSVISCQRYETVCKCFELFWAYH